MKKLGFGAMRLPLKNEEDLTSVDLETTTKMIDLFMKNGFNYFDTAYSYHFGASEEALKKGLVERYPREDFLLADKMPLFSLEKEENLEEFFDIQLERCGVEYFDYYLLHNLSKWTEKAFREFNAFDFVLKKKEEGKIKRIGISLHDTSEMLEEVLQEFPEIEFVQIQVNYLDWNNESIQSQKCYEIARKYNKDIIIMEPLKGGALANIPKSAENSFKEYHPDLSSASWAIRYCASLKGILIVLSGMGNVEQVKDNISYMTNFKPLNDKERDIIQNNIEIINGSIAIPCTQCNYCADSCPTNIPIPKFFELYNLEKRFPPTGFSHQQVYYRAHALNNSKGSDCIECGACEEQCPQHLPIKEDLKGVVELFEDENY